MATTSLIATAHGTDNPTGRGIISSIVEQVGRILPQVSVVETYVDVQFPQVNEVLEGLDPHDPAVVVPLLLSTGYHTRHDIAGAVRTRRETGAPTVATPTLGPHSLLAEIQCDRIRAKHDKPTHVVLVAAGSSDAKAQEDVEAQAKLLGEVLAQRLGVDAPSVSVGYLSAALPDVARAIELIPADQRGHVVLNSYLLAPGFFQKKLQRIVDAVKDFDGELHVSEPLNDDPRIAEIVVQRFTEHAE